MSRTSYLFPGDSRWDERVNSGPNLPIGAVQLLVAVSADTPERLLGEFVHSPKSTQVVLAGAADTLSLRLRVHSMARCKWWTDRAVVCTTAGSPAPPLALTLLNARPAPLPSAARHWLPWPSKECAQTKAAESVFEPTPLVPLRTYRHFLARWLGCTPLQLAWLWRLATIPRLRPNIEALAADAGTSTLTLRRRVKELLGIPLRLYNQCPGWEWVIELAVQRGLVEFGPLDGRWRLLQCVNGKWTRRQIGEQFGRRHGRQRRPQGRLH